MPQVFENFIVGISNRLAFATAKAICDHPKNKYNPLFIYGQKGTGKTHLLKAIEYELNLRNPDFIVKYINLNFFNDLLLYAENDTDALNVFRKEMREGDVFLFDNIDYLQKNEVSKEEFFHTFNEIFKNGGQIVISSRLSIKELDNFPERLTSRLESGLAVYLAPPTFETRMLFYEKLLEEKNIKFEKDAIEELAHKQDSNFIKMHKKISDLLIFIGDKKEEIITKTTIKNFLNIEEIKKVYEPQEIQLAVAKYLGVKPMEMLSSSRIAKIVEARHIAIYLIRKLTNYTLKEVGVLFGKRHHTTIMHAQEEIEQKIENNKNFNILINNIIQQIDQ